MLYFGMAYSSQSSKWAGSRHSAGGRAMWPSWGVLLLSLSCGSMVSFSYVGALDFDREDSICPKTLRKDTGPRIYMFPNRYEEYLRNSPPKTINIPVICLHDNLHDANRSNDISHVDEYYKNETFGKYAFLTLHGKGESGASGTGEVLLRNSKETEVPDLLCRGVRVKSNMTVVMLVVTSSCLLPDSYPLFTTSGTFTIKQGDLDNKTSGEMNRRVLKERVLLAKVLWVTNVTAAPQVFIVCDMKLCHNLWFQSCPAGCSPLFSINSPLTVFLETDAQENSLTDATFYTVLVLGIVLGCVIVGVVVMLVKKYFARARSQPI